LKSWLRQNFLTAALLLFTLLEILWIGHVTHFVRQQGYLPAPFFMDKSDTFMDFFHPLYWSDHPGRYDDWRSVYPPLNFLILKTLKLLFWGVRDFPDAFRLRQLGTMPVACLVLLYFGSVLAVLFSPWYRRYGTGQRILLFFVIVLSAPLLFSLERGNLVILCLPALLLAFSEKRWVAVLGTALLINLKPYFVLLLARYAVRRDGRGLLDALLASAGIFLVTGLLVDPNFPYMLQNLFSFARDDDLFSGKGLLSFPTSVSAFSLVLQHVAQKGQPFGWMTPQFMLLGAQAISIAKAVALLFALMTLCKKGGETDEAHLMILLLLLILNAGVSVGGYSILFLLVVLPLFFEMRRGWLYILLVALMYVPLDAIAVYARDAGVQYSYISERPVHVVWELGLGGVLRPFLNLALLVFFSWDIFRREEIRLSTTETLSAGKGMKWGEIEGSFI